MGAGAVSRTLTVPAACLRGHDLIARTTYVATAGGRAVGWECLRCLRVDLYRAHYGPRAEVPDDLLDEVRFVRQRLQQQGKPIQALAAVEFASGWGFDDPDPTAELRAVRPSADDFCAS